MPRTKNQLERKRAALVEQFKNSPYLAVGDLISLLRTFPQHLAVTGYNGGENTDFVTVAGVRLQEGEDRAWGINQDHVDIMGL